MYITVFIFLKSKIIFPTLKLRDDLTSVVIHAFQVKYKNCTGRERWGKPGNSQVRLRPLTSKIQKLHWKRKLRGTWEQQSQAETPGAQVIHAVSAAGPQWGLAPSMRLLPATGFHLIMVHTAQSLPVLCSDLWAPTSCCLWLYNHWEFCVKRIHIQLIRRCDLDSSRHEISCLNPKAVGRFLCLSPV